jgi:hypothetical protein
MLLSSPDRAVLTVGADGHLQKLDYSSTADLLEAETRI